MSNEEIEQNDTVVAEALKQIKVDYEVASPNCHLYAYLFSRLMDRGAIHMVHTQNGISFNDYLSDFLFKQWATLKTQFQRQMYA